MPLLFAPTIGAAVTARLHFLGSIEDALGIESDDVVNYCFPKTWPADRKQRAGIIGTWLTTEARYLAS